MEAEIDPHNCADARQKKTSHKKKKKIDRPYLIIDKDFLHENTI